MRWISIVGARPQFVKIAPVSRAVLAHNAAGVRTIEDLIVHTGQHYDAGMSDVFFTELAIPVPAVHLGVGSASHGEQTARMLHGIEKLLLERKPDVVVIYGDTNSTLAGALAAAKLHIPIAHVEAGLRSFNRLMPEEVNRVAADHVSDMLLAPTETAVANLRNEGLAARTHLSGDVMLDAVRYNVQRARERSDIIARLELEVGAYGVLTLHRADNTQIEQLVPLLQVLNEIAAQDLPLVFPIHPRTRQLLNSGAVAWAPHSRLQVIEPLGYLDMLRLVDGSRLVLTDSGGLQKEAFFLERPCVTLRTETEWVETVAAGANKVVGADADAIRAAVGLWLRQPLDTVAAAARSSIAFGDGEAAHRIVTRILAMG